MIRKQVSFIYAIPVLQMIKLAEDAPISGRIVLVTMHFPPGCHNIVHAAFGCGGAWICPSEINEFISLNDATPTFPVDYPVEKGKYLWVELRNGDIVNPHTIQVLVTIEGEEIQ